MSDWIDRSTLEREWDGFQPGPTHVPRMDMQTLPVLYKFGLKPMRPWPVVRLVHVGFSTG